MITPSSAWQGTVASSAQPWENPALNPGGGQGMRG